MATVNIRVKPFEYRNYCLFAMVYGSIRDMHEKREAQYNQSAAFAKLVNSELWKRFVDISVPEKDFWLVVRIDKVGEYLTNGLQNLVYRDDYIYENYVAHYFMLTLKYTDRKLPTKYRIYE